MEQSSIVARRLWQVVRAVFYMLRVRGGGGGGGISKKKLMLDFHLFVDRSKIAGKTFIYQLLHHNHHHHHNNNNLHLPKWKKANKHQNNDYNNYNKHQNNDYFHNFDVKEIARALEALHNGNESPYVDQSPMWSVGKLSPAAPTYMNQLRITDSPFPVIEEDGDQDNKEIDMEAEEFIRKFYEQLRSQQSVPATPVSKIWAN